MATITSIQSGDWSDSTTWDGGIVPVSTDNIVVSAGHTVVMNVNFVTTGKISNNGTLTILNPLQIGLHGDGVTRRPGTLEVGPKSLINGHGSIYPCYGEMKSSPENQEWAKISVNILDLPDVPENQKAEIRYSFRFTAFSFFFGNNGISRFPCRGTGLFSFLNCTFSGFGNTSLRFGAGGGITLSETPIIFSGCDFRNCGDIFFITSDGTADVKKHFNKLTFFSDTRKTINFEARTDKTNVVSDSVFINYEQKSDGTDFPIKNINVFLGRTLDRWSVLTEKHKNSMLQSSYVYVPSDIFNGIGVEIATVSEGVFECQSSANPIMHRGHYVPHDVPFLTSGVLHLGYGAMAGILADESRSWKIENCTRISESVSSTNSLWLSQTGVLSNIENGLVARNCMQACLAGAPDTNTCRTSADAYLQEIDFDYNRKWNVTNFLQENRFANTNSGDHNADAEPRFVDPERGFVQWARMITGNPKADHMDGAMFLLAQNGYNPETCEQDEALSTGYQVANLISWVREGFAPQNKKLAASGEGGTYIGAVPVPERRVLKDSAWNVLSRKTNLSSWMILNRKGRQSSWHLFARKRLGSVWNILSRSSIASSWHICSGSRTPSSWHVLAGIKRASAWHILNRFTRYASWNVFSKKRPPTLESYRMREKTRFSFRVKKRR